MTSDFGGSGKRGTTGNVAGSVVPEFSWGHPGIMDGGSPTEVSLRSRDVGPRGYAYGPDPSEKYFSHTRSDRKNPARPELKRPGIFFEYAGPVRPGFVGAGSPALVLVACVGAGPGLY